MSRATKLRVSTRPEGFIDVEKEVVLGTDQQFSTFKLVAKRRPYGGDVIVTVVDEAGKPISGAKLINRGNSTALERKATSDAEGQARISNLYESLDGKTVVVSAEGYVSRRIAVTVGTKANPSVAEAVLHRGATIKGRVLLPSGEAAKKLRVYYADGEHGRLEGGRVATDDTGRFIINGAPEGCTFTIYVPKGCAPFDDQTLPLDQDEEVIVQLQPEGIVRAQAIDSMSGKSIKNYNVRITFSQLAKAGEPSRGFPTQWIREGFDIEPADKEFRLGGLPPGMPLQLTVSSEGYEPTVVPRVVAEAEDVAQVEHIKLSAIDRSTYRNVGGVIRRTDGSPVGGAHVRLLVGKSKPPGANGGFRGGWSSLYNWSMLERGDIARHAECIQFLKTTTDRDGNFKFSDVRPGKWLEVYCTGEGIAATRLGDIQDRSKKELAELELTVQQPATLQVHVDRKAWPKAYQIQLSSPSVFALTATYSYTAKTLEGETEQVLFENVPPGEYRLTVETAFERLPAGRLRNETLHSVTVKLKAGETAKREF